MNVEAHPYSFGETWSVTFICCISDATEEAVHGRWNGRSGWRGWKCWSHLFWQSKDQHISLLRLPSGYSEVLVCVSLSSVSRLWLRLSDTNFCILFMSTFIDVFICDSLEGHLNTPNHGFSDVVVAYCKFGFVVVDLIH